jgi:threonine aldolase
MVFITVEPGRSAALRDHLRRRDVLVSGQRTIRLVTHLDIDGGDIRRFVRTVEEFFDAA